MVEKPHRVTCYNMKGKLSRTASFDSMAEASRAHTKICNAIRKEKGLKGDSYVPTVSRVCLTTVWSETKIA